MSRPKLWVGAIVLTHLAITLVHGIAHQRLQIELSAYESLFVMICVLALPLLALALIWTRGNRFGLALLAIAMFGSLAFGLFHHFLATGADNVNSQPDSSLGAAFVWTAYALAFTEALGAYFGAHFLFRKR